jgi:UTP-glucose-1-phosphate uridylyltransferase
MTLILYICKEAKKKGIAIIHNILRNNKYDIKTLNTTHHKLQKQKDNTNKKQKWATFTYHGKQTRKLTQLFKYKKKHKTHHNIIYAQLSSN